MQTQTTLEQQRQENVYYTAVIVSILHLIPHHQVQSTHRVCLKIAALLTPRVFPQSLLCHFESLCKLDWC